MDYLKYYQDMSADDYIKDVKKNWFKMWEFWKEFVETHDVKTFEEKTAAYYGYESNLSMTFHDLRDILLDEAEKIVKHIESGHSASKHEAKIKSCYNDAWKIWAKSLITPINGKEEGDRIIRTYYTGFAYYLGKVAVFEACFLAIKLERENRPSSIARRSA